MKIETKCPYCGNMNRMPFKIVVHGWYEVCEKCQKYYEIKEYKYRI